MQQRHPPSPSLPSEISSADYARPAIDRQIVKKISNARRLARSAVAVQRSRATERNAGIADHQWLNKGFPNNEGAKSSRKSSNWVLAPMWRPDALLSGTIASTAICQVTAT